MDSKSNKERVDELIMIMKEELIKAKIKEDKNDDK